MYSDSDLILRFVWQAALVLSILSIGIAFVLTFRRWLEEREKSRMAVRQVEISNLVQAMLASPREPDVRSAPALQPGDEPALFSVALDILRVTRGQDAVRMLKLVELWNLRPYLVKLLAGRSRNQRIRALTLLTHFRDPESLDMILEHIEDAAVYVQLAALRGVADRGNAWLLPLVVSALMKARETNVPVLADILRRFGEPAVPALTDLARGTAIPAVRLAAVMALGSIGSLDAFSSLRDLTRDPIVGVRVRALQALAQLGDPRAETAIQRGLVDDEARVRAEAAKAAGLLGLREVLPSLADALNDEVWDVRYRAAEALYSLGAPGVAVLRAIADDLTPPGAEDEGESIRVGMGVAADLGPAMAAEMLAEKEGIPA